MAVYETTTEGEYECEDCGRAFIGKPATLESDQDCPICRIADLERQLAEALAEVDMMHNLPPGEGILKQAKEWKARAEAAEADTARLDKLNDKALLDVGIAVSALGGIGVREWHGEMPLRDFIDSIEDETIDAARSGEGE